MLLSAASSEISFSLCENCPLLSAQQCVLYM